MTTKATIRKQAAQFVPVDSVATYLGISERKVREFIRRGRLPIVRLGRRTIRIDRADLQTFIDERRERRGKEE